MQVFSSRENIGIPIYARMNNGPTTVLAMDTITNLHCIAGNFFHNNYHQLISNLLTRVRADDFRRIHAVLQELDVQEARFTTRAMDVLKTVVVTVSGRHEAHINFYPILTQEFYFLRGNSLSIDNAYLTFPCNEGVRSTV